MSQSVLVSTSNVSKQTPTTTIVSSTDQTSSKLFATTTTVTTQPPTATVTSITNSAIGNVPSSILTSTQISTHAGGGTSHGLSALPKQTRFFKEAVPVDDYGPALLIRETIFNHKHLRQRIRDLEKININNDQIILFFVGTPDKNGRSWHADSNLVEKAINFLLKKLQVGGFLLKVHVGGRKEWLDMDNVYRKDPKIELMNIPTLWAWGTAKRIFGKRCFDLESLYLLLKD